MIDFGVYSGPHWKSGTNAESGSRPGPQAGAPFCAVGSEPRHGIENPKSLAAKPIYKDVGGIAANEQNTLGTEAVWLFKTSRNSLIQKRKRTISPTTR